MDSQKIRQQFTDFFNDKGHAIVPSAPLVLKGDPTLMFVNSGMAPFKEYFLGNAEPKDSRIADTQKCLRVSGKHNDLEEVGYDTYHHTLFEMLGNWSFGDYFKAEAIEWAWELLTEVYKIDKENLYVTVFEGDKDDGLEMDREAYEIWKKYIPEERILKGNKKDNFWEMGEQGPCGPCSEIHVDIRPESEKSKVPGKDLVNQDHPEVVEIWNLVFMQYNRKANGSLEPLPHKHIDTGMGFERLCMVLQGVRSNYDTDVFKPLITKLENLSGKSYGKDEEIDVAIRVISDHVRAVTFSIADGQLPSNTGAGYVIRRILRRAIRFGFTFLNQKEPFIYKLVEVLAERMGEAFPELRTQQRLVEKVIEEEERSFLNTLDQGLAMIHDLVDKAKGKTIAGEKIFELYDTYGFPVDLTAMILREKGFSFNMKDFEAEMKKQRDRSRSASETSTGDWVIVKDNEQSEFIGYDSLESEVELLRYRKVSSKKGGDQYQIVLNKTPFYAEGGGQVGDTGWIENEKGEKIEILDTKKENNVIYHLVTKLPDPHSTFTATVNKGLRQTTTLNHTATHLLHQALRQVLGKHVEQKGSAVNPNYLRFDFSHFSKVTNDELQQVEDFVNKRISEALELEENRNASMQEAIDKGAIALFGEKYGDKVRTVKFGDSIELCGGTHVSNTANIWYFKITSESAVAAGVRRIEAITGPAAMEYFKETEEKLLKIKQALNNPQNVITAVENLKDENQSLQKTVEELKKEKEKNLKSDLRKEFEEINGIKFLAKKVDLDSNGMKNLSFELGNELDNVFILLGSAQDGKALISCFISKNLTQETDLNAGQIVRDLGKFIQGGGGGQPFYATAGGKNIQGIDEALSHAKSYLV